jgi:hypothetical protein
MLVENRHTAPSFSFAHYVGEAAKSRRKKYFSENFELTTRASVFGATNGCVGDCEGTGWVPVYRDEVHNTDMRRLYTEAEADMPSDDGWQFLPCPDCRSTSELDEHIVKKGSEYSLRSKKSNKNLGTYKTKAGAEHREREVEYFKHLKEDSQRPTSDEKKEKDDPKNSADSKEQSKQKSKEERQAKTKERERKKLLPYEFDSQKDAERSSGHLGISGSHLSGAGIYKPGSSDQSLRDAVSRKKQKEKMKTGKVNEDFRNLLSNIRKSLS